MSESLELYVVESAGSVGSKTEADDNAAETAAATEESAGFTCHLFITCIVA